MKIKSFFSQYLPVIISAIILTVCLAYAWTPPSSPPPSGNVSTPINTGDTPQSKTGDLNIGGGLKYWITKLGDSFALKNDSGEIKFIVGQDGNTGIGATDPKNKLEVKGDVGLQKYSTKNGEPRAIYVFGHKGTGAQYGMHLGYANNRWRTRIFAPTGRDITFGFHNSTLTNPTQADWSEKVIIRDNGNVGIGRSDPQAKLHVNGRIRAHTPLASDPDDTVATKGYVDAQIGPKWAGYTSTAYYGYNAGGTKGVNQKCNAEYPGSHACTYDEIIKLGTEYPWAKYAWVIDGQYSDGTTKDCTEQSPSSYLPNCGGWSTKTSGLKDGAVTSPGGYLIKQDCQKSKYPFPCCY